MVAYQGGDESAFEAIYDRYHRRLYNFLLRLTANPDKARDLFQMTFLTLHRNRKRYRPTGRFSSWVFTLAANVARDEFRRAKRKREVSLETTGADDTCLLDRHAARPANQHTRVERHEAAETVQKAIMGLPPGQRVVVLLSRYADMTYPEIAEVLRIKPNAVKQRAHEALRSLGRALEDSL